MQAVPGDRRFFASTRGRVLVLLRRASRSVEELAAALELTENAVRAHLATLERDGLVQHAGQRRGTSKPAYTYRLTPAANRLFPKAYERLLGQILDMLQEELPPAARDALLVTVGRRLAAAEPWPATDPSLPAGEALHARAVAAAEVLNKLGGLTEVEESEGTYYICGYHCPFAEVVQTHPELCQAVQALLTATIGQPVEERCARRESLWCWFAIPPPAAAQVPT